MKGQNTASQGTRVWVECDQQVVSKTLLWIPIFDTVVQGGDVGRGSVDGVDISLIQLGGVQRQHDHRKRDQHHQATD